MNRRIVLLQALATAPRELKGLLGAMPATAAERRPVDGWSAVEIVRHLLDVEARYRARLQRVIDEERPPLEPILPPAGGYAENETAQELFREFQQARQEMVAFLKPLSRADWQRCAIHPSWGESSFYLLVQRLVDHDREHLNQVAGLTEPWSTGKSRSEREPVAASTEEGGRDNEPA